MVKRKRRLGLLATVIAVVILAYGLLCAVIDPFGVFGDPVIDCYSFNITKKPSLAKVAYLEKYGEQYDSYVIGSSAATAFSTARLDSYTGGRFYNLATYESDLEQTAAMANYVITEHNPKSILMAIDLARHEGQGEGALSTTAHYKVTSSNPLAFYSRFVFLDWHLLRGKLEATKADSYLPHPFIDSSPRQGSTTEGLKTPRE